VIEIAQAATIELTHEAVNPDQIVAGSPTTAIADLGEFDRRAYGVWEMTVGAMSDVEEDELFVVLFGAATVEFIDEQRVIELRAGSVVTLVAGARTVWTVTETLRKIWVAGA
jgi:uncharacterized cupin superfamily protein